MELFSSYTIERHPALINTHSSEVWVSSPRDPSFELRHQHKSYSAFSSEVQVLVLQDPSFKSLGFPFGLRALGAGRCFWKCLSPWSLEFYFYPFCYLVNILLRYLCTNKWCGFCPWQHPDLRKKKKKKKGSWELVSHHYSPKTFTKVTRVFFQRKS